MTKRFDVRVIKLGASTASAAGLPDATLQLFPQAVAVQAVDVRGMRPEEAVRNGTLSLAGYKSIVHGRAQHSQMPTMGALGLYLSWRSALQGHGPLLLLEEDCQLSAGIHKALRQFEELELDVGMIGASAHGGRRHRSTAWVFAPDMAFEAHCVAFSAQARERVGAYVNAHAASMQVDALLCELSVSEDLRLGVYADKSAAWQPHDSSTIQLPAQHVRVPNDYIAHFPPASHHMQKQKGSSLSVATAILTLVLIVMIGISLVYFIFTDGRKKGTTK